MPEPCEECNDTGLVMVDSGLVYGVHGGQVEQPCTCPAGERVLREIREQTMRERTERYEQQVSIVVGQARQVARQWVAQQVVGERTTLTLFELAMFELQHAIGVLDEDGIEPDDDE